MKRIDTLPLVAKEALKNTIEKARRFYMSEFDCESLGEVIFPCVQCPFYNRKGKCNGSIKRTAEDWERWEEEEI